MEIMARLVILVLRSQRSLASQPIMLELQASEGFCLKKLEKGEREKREKERETIRGIACKVVLWSPSPCTYTYMYPHT